jgi:hypothetical protein
MQVMQVERDINDEISDNSKKKTRVRPTRIDKYKMERNNLINNLEILMNLTEKKRGILLYDLEQDILLKKYLKEKIPEIKKIFKCGCWNYFIQKEEDRNEIGLLKSIFKNEGFKILSKRKYMDINGVKKQFNILYFYKELELNSYFD